MKSLRKSLNNNKENSKLQISTPIPTLSKPSSAILPPQKVIRALTTYKSQAPQELSFVKGDFFYVIKDHEDSSWYEAHNPVTGSRGIVPRAMFEEFSKNSPASSRASQIPSPGAFKSAPSPGIRPAPPAPVSKTYYAVVLHDFNAERTDELDAKRGDSITVVAQSNREWFVAKPIGRLGRPGLIPVSFVQVHDPATGKPIDDVDSIIDRGDLPKVEEWKRAMLSYKQNSISLGVIDPPTRSSVPNSPYMSQEAYLSTPLPPEPERPPTPDCLPEGILLSADVVSFHYEMEEYWFRIDAIFQPYASGQNSLPPAKQLILFRVYNDFYEFQVSLLNTFPREAGRQPPHPRTLPFMPGPAKEVDDALTASRREELNDYIHGLCALGKSGGRYILEHQVVRTFLALKPGDVENSIDPCYRDIEALFGQSSYSPDPDDIYAGEDYASEVSQRMGQMKVQEGRRSDDGSDYEDEGYAPSPQGRPYDRHPYSQSFESRQSTREESLRIQINHQRSGSSTSFNKYPYSSHSRSHSPQTDRTVSPLPPHHNGYSDGTQSQWPDDGHHPQSNGNQLSSASFRSSRSRSHSTSTTNNFNNPPISAANPQTAFVKIKIFDRVADDLIAIRVHPKVSHLELMEKVQSRLGSEVRILKYRDSLTNTFVGLDSDDDLRAWMEGTDKHVLYAD